jgi:hypothetical protein
MGNGPGFAVVAVAIWIVLFLVFRAIVLWYWRVDEGIPLLKSIDQKLDRIAGNTPEGTEPYLIRLGSTFASPDPVGKR